MKCTCNTEAMGDIGHFDTCPAIAELKNLVTFDPYKCGSCKKPLKPVYDTISKKMSEWNFNCSCPDWPKGLVKSVG